MTDWMAPYQGVRVLVTGASGFLGRWLARVLTRARAELVLAVRDPALMQSVALEYDVSGTIVAVDFRDAGAIASLLRDTQPAVTFNAVGYGIDRREQDEEQLRDINALAVTRIGEAVARYGRNDWRGMTLVHLGSALEYGAVGGNLSETIDPKPTTPYGLAKLRGTSALAQLSVRESLPALTARLFTVYGPGEHPGRLLPTLLDAVRERRPVSLSAGTQKRDFTYVGDVAEGLLRLGVSSAAPGSVVNLATGRLQTVRHFAQVTAETLGMPLEDLQFGAVQQYTGEMEHENVSVDRLDALVHWRPTTEVADGVRATWDFYASRQSR
jgi:nucleoside-diphosphate-sugar epimerase